MVERASSVPLSASCMVNRAEMLALVERARAELPVELDQAAELLVAHQEVISRAETEAEELLAQAQADAEQMIMESALVASARARSEQILDAARDEAARLLRECDMYTDNRLAALEADLQRTMGQVRRGRDRLRDRSELDYLDPLADDADPEGRDVQAEHEAAVERRREQGAQEERTRARAQAYDHQVDTEDAYDQEREGAPGIASGVASGVASGLDGEVTGIDAVPGNPEPSGAGLTSPPQEPELVPVGVGAGPERRVIDLTAVERAADRSGLVDRAT
ncbi:hypothetical protein [Kineosporia sp. NBRC 101731]|uniref:hypothetical protein n=1 Tax=Kineosporia sp. NBRC 101731 TaxID=3032199 RepID=UPI0025553DFD|nr:hypothetical protein [Kineosporia sp. NBRC 101731]